MVLFFTNSLWGKICNLKQSHQGCGTAHGIKIYIYICTLSHGGHLNLVSLAEAYGQTRMQDFGQQEEREAWGLGGEMKRIWTNGREREAMMTFGQSEGSKRIEDNII